MQLAINRCYGEVQLGGCNDEADPAAKPRLKLILLQNGGGVSATEYPKSSRRRRRRPDDLRARRRRRRRSASAPSPSTTARRRVLLLARPRHPLLRPGRRQPRPPHRSRPEVIAKPDVAATDCGRTTFFVPSTKTPGLFRFCGTSAAAPHAAAVAALARQAEPVAVAVPGRGRHCAPRPSRSASFGPDAVGAGLVDAYGGDRSDRPAAEDHDHRTPARLDAQPPAERRLRRRTGPPRSACSVDGAAAQPCGSPFVRPNTRRRAALGSSVSGAFREWPGRQRAPVSFTVDATPPRTFFRIHPRKTLRTRRGRVRVVFRFGSNERGVRFTCGLDKSRARPFAGARARPGLRDPAPTGCGSWPSTWPATWTRRRLSSTSALRAPRRQG